MINLKKVGLTALAGSLVAFSANAADLSVTGGVEVTYTDTGGTGLNTLTGNPWGANSNMALSASGDVGFGTVFMHRGISQTGGLTSSYQTLDMGDAGVLSFDSTAGALVGITANDDLLPTAYEESWAGVSASGISGVGSTNVIGYQNTIGGISISAGYTNADGATATGESASSVTGHGSVTDVNLKMSLIDGLTISAGVATNTSTNKATNATADTEEVVGHVLYSNGPVSVGYRMAQSDSGAAATAGTEMEGYSIAFNVNDNFAISYGVQDTTKNAIGATAAVTEAVDGFSAAYTVGAASVRLNHSNSSNDGKVSGVDDETTEIGVVLSF
jgi:outer membrane protein OmpU